MKQDSKWLRDQIQETEASISGKVERLGMEIKDRAKIVGKDLLIQAPVRVARKHPWSVLGISVAAGLLALYQIRKKKRESSKLVYETRPSKKGSAAIRAYHWAEATFPQEVGALKSWALHSALDKVIEISRARKGKETFNEEAAESPSLQVIPATSHSNS